MASLMDEEDAIVQAEAELKAAEAAAAEAIARVAAAAAAEAEAAAAAVAELKAAAARSPPPRPPPPTATVAATATATAAPSHARSRARHPVVTKLDGWRITHNQDGFGVEEFLTHWTARSGNLQAEWRTKDELVNDYEGDVKDKDAMRLAALQLPSVHSE